VSPAAVVGERDRQEQVRSPRRQDGQVQDGHLRLCTL
jgi:hypothetical protein